MRKQGLSSFLEKKGGRGARGGEKGTFYFFEKKRGWSAQRTLHADRLFIAPVYVHQRLRHLADRGVQPDGFDHGGHDVSAGRGVIAQAGQSLAHRAIVARELNPERRAFYQLAWQRVLRKFLQVTVFERRSPFLMACWQGLSGLDVQSIAKAVPVLIVS